MSNVFSDQHKFMRACDQVVDQYNESQYNMYLKLIGEEYHELELAHEQGDRVEELDALIDILVVTVGALHSLGVDANGAWKEVMRSNFAKIDKQTGRVRKREDGKVLKPVGWEPPRLAGFLNSEHRE
jgi:predicted HAD superfamily Cof-like phosphohydrolase